METQAEYSVKMLAGMRVTETLARSFCCVRPPLSLSLAFFLVRSWEAPKGQGETTDPAQHLFIS